MGRDSPSRPDNEIAKYRRDAEKYAASGSTTGHLSYQIGQRLGSSMAE
jgi:hypothetical protein